MDLKIKSLLYDHCLKLAHQRIQNSEEALSSAQESANHETKSTAGDKHDTSRAMMHLETERLGKQLNEAQKLKRVLQGIDPLSRHKSVQTGSLVETGQGLFYFAISAGKFEHEGHVYYTAAPSSPVFQAMKGRKAGDTFQMNNRTIEILSIQ